MYPNSAEAATRSPSFSQLRRTAPMGSTAGNVSGHGGISGSFSSKTLGNVSGGPGLRGSFMDNTPSGSFSNSSVSGIGRRNDGFSNPNAGSSFRSGQARAAQGEGNVISSSVPKSSVHSGAAGAFNPAMFTTTRASLGPGAAVSGGKGPGMGMDDDDEQEDGVFVDRTQHERMIEQVMILSLFDMIELDARMDPICCVLLWLSCFLNHVLLLLLLLLLSILQMLKPVDEATVMQELIDERAVEIQKVSHRCCVTFDLFLVSQVS